MFQTKITFSEGQTPEQRKAHTAYWRRQDAQRRGFNNMLRFWRVCARPACRRNHTCSGDMHACFTRHWAMMAEDEKEWIRGAIKAGAGATLEQRARAADAARERYLKSIERANAPPAPCSPAEPAAAPPPSLGVRIRRL
jgi:hypothetical protein